MERQTKCSNNSEKKLPLGSCPSVEEGKMVTEKQDSSISIEFINQAAITWHDDRRKWTGTQSRHSQRSPKDPIISWSTTYEELLSTHEPFSEPIPLQEMVDFLVDIWQDEGLFD